MSSPIVPVVDDLITKHSENIKPKFSRKNSVKREKHDPEKTFQKENKHCMKLFVSQHKSKTILLVCPCNKYLWTKEMRSLHKIECKAEAQGKELNSIWESNWTVIRLDIQYLISVNRKQDSLTPSKLYPLPDKLQNIIIWFSTFFDFLRIYSLFQLSPAF